MLLEGKNAIVSGGSQGIGTATSVEFAREGANVCILYRKHADEAKRLVKEIQEMGRKAIAVQCDIASFADAERVVKTTVEEFGGVDILVNNAGMNWDGVCWKMTEEQWDRVIEVNLKGYFNFVRQVAPIFKDQKYGKIINVTCPVSIFMLNNMAPDQMSDANSVNRRISYFPAPDHICHENLVKPRAITVW